MCGIALVISGVRIDLSSLVPDGSQSALEGEQETSRVSDFSSAAPEAKKLVLSVDDLKAALLRRGPDSLGSKKVFLQSENLSSVPEQEILLLPYEGDSTRIKKTCLCCHVSKQDCRTSAEDASQAEESSVNQTNLVASFQFIGATLQLRGSTRIYQPMVDVSRNILVYNGEIFGGIHISSDSNDAEILLHALGKCCPCDSHESKETCCCIEKGKISVPELLSTIKGPWALVYWQDCSKTIWFGRDAVGRRSLLVHWPTLEDSRLVLSSVSPHSSLVKNSDLEVGDCTTKLNYWEELPCGIYSISLNSSETNGYMVGKVRKHKWMNFELEKLIEWERNLVQPNSRFCPKHLSRPREQHVVCATSADEMTSDFGCHPTIQHAKAQAGVPTSLPNKITGLDSDLAYKGSDQTSVSPSAHKVLVALRESVMRRTIVGTVLQTAPDETRKDKLAPMAILFSGGLDSMILAALLNECLDPSYDIELLNVSFDGQNAPDRITGIAGIKELNRIAPSRRWKLVEIDANLSSLALETQHVMSLIYPANTYMDLNIGIALWLAAGGDGWVNKGICNKGQDHQRCKYQSQAKVLLVGSGADEQCAGYGRHRTKYRLGSWHGLHEEMKLDMQRIWKRNLGRDDRCISDNGKEARYPFLDEDVIRTLLEIPLWEVANLDQPTGRGDKKILREVAELLGLKAASVLPKRAIQFGSRIARESNRRTFGSNRAANHASAGSVVISESSNST